jgi:hypothetical protein
MATLFNWRRWRSANKEGKPLMLNTNYLFTNSRKFSLICECGTPDAYTNTRLQWVTVPMFDVSVVSKTGCRSISQLHLLNSTNLSDSRRRRCLFYMLEMPGPRHSVNFGTWSSKYDWTSLGYLQQCPGKVQRTSSRA